FTGVFYSTKLYMGDYVFDKQLQKLIEKSEWQKIAVLKADVDNLGQAFSSGFKRNGNDPKSIYKYETLSRTAAFSRQISMFFRYYIKETLKIAPCFNHGLIATRAPMGTIKRKKRFLLLSSIKLPLNRKMLLNIFPDTLFTECF
ncbi:MAG: hypothetical protein N2Z57_02420, partial [Oscillospiraceae bacterium]|nr:hypothetical protein [Oscillospiraceae bacterium]